MQPIVYRFFKGDCRKALALYGQVFGATPEIIAFADMPAEVRARMPGAPDDAVMHATLRIGEGWLHASDDPAGETGSMAGCNISVSLPTEAETRRVYAALSEGGEIRMALGPMSWSPLYSAFTDRFGTRWMVMADAPAN